MAGVCPCQWQLKKLSLRGSKKDPVRCQRKARHIAELVYNNLFTCPNPSYHIKAFPCYPGLWSAKRKKENQLIMIYSV